MNSDLIARAQAGDEEAFRHLVDHHQRELHVHCYRILGSVEDAEDQVQETPVSDSPRCSSLARYEASYSSWRRHHMPVSLRPSGARSSHGYMPHTASSPRSYAE